MHEHFVLLIGRYAVAAHHALDAVVVEAEPDGTAPAEGDAPLAGGAQVAAPGVLVLRPQLVVRGRCLVGGRRPQAGEVDAQDRAVLAQGLLGYAGVGAAVPELVLDGAAEFFAAACCWLM